MAVSTTLKIGLNRVLRPVGVRVDSWTSIEQEAARISALEAAGKLTTPRYPLTGGMERCDPTPFADAYAAMKGDIARLKDPAQNSTGYHPVNNFFTTPDLEALYLTVRMLKPQRVVEVGCGNSTRITRQAIRDGGLNTDLIAIDPSPRADISGLTDRFEQLKLEFVDDFNARFALQPGDILFIDSSHEVFVGNDVANLFCRIIPALPAGVVVHVHDVFLPYDYPPTFAHELPYWGEQYILHALIRGHDCEVLWPGYHLQKDWPNWHDRLPFLQEGRAQSFWFRWN